MGELLHTLSLRLQSSGERAMLTLIGYVVVFLLAAFALAAFAYAAAVALAAAYGPVVAALCLGAAAALLALAVVWALALRRRKLKREMRARRLAQPAMAAVATSVLPVMVKASPFGTLLLVATAAFMLQRSGRAQRQQR